MKRAVICLGLLLGVGFAVIAHAEVVQHGKFRVAVNATLTPKRLPRSGEAPVHFALSARFIPDKGSTPPQLRQIKLEINRHGHLNPNGIPLCRMEQVQPATTANALAACRDALVGEGTFQAKVLFTQQAPFPSTGKLVAFNGIIGCSPRERLLRSRAFHRSGRLWSSSSRTQGGRPGDRTSLPGRGSEEGTSPVSIRPTEREQRTGDWRLRDPQAGDRGHRDARCHSRPAILAHIYGPKPIPTSNTIPFLIEGISKGTYGTQLVASLPQFSGKWGYVTGISMTLGRSFSSQGKRRTYLSASCPAPDGVPIVSFPLSRAGFGFSGHQTVKSTLTGSCRARGN